MRVISVLLGFLLLSIVGCLHTQKEHIPNEDIYFLATFGRMSTVLYMEKGFLDEENKGSLWWPYEEVERRVEK